MYTVIDLETTTRCSYKRKANPFDPLNWIVAVGWKHSTNPCASWTYYKQPTIGRGLPPELDLSNTNILVGFNLPFDLLYLWRDPRLIEFFKRGGWIWDCQYAEYLLEGQHEKAHYAKLTETAPKYGGTKKIDAVAELWNAGVDTPDIQQDLLIDYLVGTEAEGRNGGDIGNTEKIFLGQVKRAKELGMVAAIKDRMDGLCCTTEMQYNGLKIDMAVAKENLIRLMQEEADITERLRQYVPADIPPELGFSWTNARHLSAILFGGTLKYERRMPILNDRGQPTYTKKTVPGVVLLDGRKVPADSPEVTPESVARFLSGKKKGEVKTCSVPVQGDLKTKMFAFTYAFPRVVEPDPSTATKNTDAAGNPVYKTGDDELAVLPDDKAPFIKERKRLACIMKETGTYYIRQDKAGNLSGMLTCVQPWDHIIHHKLNSTSTVTSRLSSSDPNLQNLPRKENGTIKQVFISRFGADGMMIEVDYSQLEVIVQAVLSEDTQLARDIRNGVDFHCKRVSAWKKVTYEDAVEWCKNENHPNYPTWKPIRTNAKVFSFQRAYGAGAEKIAATTGMPKADVKELIEAEDAMYPGVVKFNTAVMDAVEASAKPFYDPVAGKMYRRGYWMSPTKTLYTWRSYDAPDFLAKRGVTDTFKPTEIKNYPTQGTGGQMVQTTGGDLWRHFLMNDNYGGLAFLVNTVHDCNWADAHKTVCNQVIADMLRIMQNIPERFNKTYGLNITVPFKAEAECGPNMFNLSHPKETYA